MRFFFICFFLVSLVFVFVSLTLRIFAVVLLKNPLNVHNGGILAIVAGVFGGFDVFCILAGVMAFYSDNSEGGRKRKSEWVMSGL